MVIRPAVAAALVHEGRILMVRRRHPPHAGRLALPGGKLDAGEDHARAAVRELQEETGLVARPGAVLETVVVAVPAADGRPASRYRIRVVAMHWRGGEGVAGSDAEALVWLDRRGLEAAGDAVLESAARIAHRLLP